MPRTMPFGAQPKSSGSMRSTRRSPRSRAGTKVPRSWISPSASRRKPKPLHGMGPGDPVIERPRQDRFRSTPEMTQEISMPDEMTSRLHSPADMRRRSLETRQRGARPPFECIALLLQGGGALGSYQAGVYQSLAEAGLHPDWVAGISIGAINSALIAGNPPDKRVERLREFWEAVSTSPLGIPYLKSFELRNEFTHQLVNQARALNVLLFGAPNFFTPRLPPATLWPGGSADKASYYDNTPLKATLERLVDFDRINAGRMRFSVGAVNVRTGNFAYFDSTTHRIRPQHVMASVSLPPGFAATEIDGEYYWDGGLVSNTPLQWVLASRPRRDTLAFQVDLWSA